MGQIAAAMECGRLNRSFRLYRLSDASRVVGPFRALVLCTNVVPGRRCALPWAFLYQPDEKERPEGSAASPWDAGKRRFKALNG